MKKLFLSLLALGCVAGAFAQSGRPTAGGKKKIAIYVTGGTEDANKLVRNQLEEAFVYKGSGTYTVIAITPAIQELLDSARIRELSGNVRDEDISASGRLSGVDIICATEISTLNDKYTIVVKLLDRTARMYESKSDNKVANLEHLGQITKWLADGLLGVKSQRPKPPKSPKPPKPPRPSYDGFQMITEGLTLPDVKQWGGNFIIGGRFNHHVALGVGGGYHVYSGEKTKGAIIPGFVDFRVNAFPFLISPYFAVAGGVCLDRYTNTDTYVDLTGAVEKTSEHQALYAYYQASAGLHIRFSQTGAFAIFAGAAYNNIAEDILVQAGFSLTF